jgi:hypothetical protein
MSDVVLRCGQCGLPWAKISNGVLVVESRHHGDRHVNVISLDELARMWGAANAMAGLDEAPELAGMGTAVPELL